MSKIFKERIEAIINSPTIDKTGFTSIINWVLNRYIVANTHNAPDVSIEKLTQQADNLYLAYDNVNLWGWQDNETGNIYLDISTSFDSLEKAIDFARETKQIAIWDNVDFKEIKIEY